VGLDYYIFLFDVLWIVYACIEIVHM